jgi:hypothetical protein
MLEKLISFAYNMFGGSVADSLLYYGKGGLLRRATCSFYTLLI